MTHPTEVLNQYRTLADYCDAFFARVKGTYSHDVACQPGCAHCCILQTVCALEAAVISSEVSRLHETGSRITAGTSSRTCPLLHNDRCQIYPARPLICRTHGLLLGRFDDGVARKRSTCTRNFTNRADDELPSVDVLDDERITANLMKLNLAWCILTRHDDLAGRRIALRDIAQGTRDADIPTITEPRSRP